MRRRSSKCVMKKNDESVYVGRWLHSCLSIYVDELCFTCVISFYCVKSKVASDDILIMCWLCRSMCCITLL